MHEHLDNRIDYNAHKLNVINSNDFLIKPTHRTLKYVYAKLLITGNRPSLR